MMTQHNEQGCDSSSTPRGPSAGWRQEFVQTPAHMWRVFGRLEAEMIALGYPDKDVFAVKLVLGEAIVNAVKHGHRGDEKKRVQVRYQVTRDEVLAEVLDEGAGFDPSLVPDPRLEENLDRPGGRGLFLMQVYMSWVRFNERGNGVTFCRQRSGAGKQN